MNNIQIEQVKVAAFRERSWNKKIEEKEKEEGWSLLIPYKQSGQFIYEPFPISIL